MEQTYFEDDRTLGDRDNLRVAVLGNYFPVARGLRQYRMNTCKVACIYGVEEDVQFLREHVEICKTRGSRAVHDRR